MQSNHFSIPANHPAGSAHLFVYVTIGTTKDSSLWKKTIRFVLR
jgi:hypothetical protein